MRIATYNVWNSESGMPDREKYIIDEIVKANADIICLQELHNKEQAERIADRAGYKYVFFDSYENEEEGLGILSKLPFAKETSWINVANAMFASVLYKEKIISIVNLHLPWNSTLERERKIVDIALRLNSEIADCFLLAGDFNCSDTADVNRFLIGECSLRNVEASPIWYDLALSYAELTKTEAECTLNFRKNPRFFNNTIELNSRFDRIMLRNTYPAQFPILKECGIFGEKIYEDIKLSASDHYGVVAEIELN